MTEDLKPDAGGLHRFLLGPFFLYEELVGAFLPGVLFLLLLLMKDVTVLKQALGLSVLGYRTKIAAALLVGYVVGKVFQIPSNSLLNRFTLSMLNGKWLKDAADTKAPLISRLGKAGEALAGGTLVGLLISGFTNPLEVLLVARSNVAFRVSSSLVLISASLIKGDGRPLRLFEAGVGVILLVLGIVEVQRLATATIMMLAMAMVEKLTKASKVELALLTVAVKTLFGSGVSAQVQSMAEAATPKAAEKAEEKPGNP